MGFRVDFKDLYRLCENQPSRIGFEFLRKAIIHGTEVEEIHVVRHVYQPETRNAHYKLYDDRSSAYNGECIVFDINYCSSLEGRPLDLGFALCKELMHVFDPIESRINSKEKFKQFLRDMQNLPIQNDHVTVERIAQWMAVLVLFPKKLRDATLKERDEKGMLMVELVQRLLLPERVIASGLDTYYDIAWTTLTQ